MLPLASIPAPAPVPHLTVNFQVFGASSMTPVASKSVDTHGTTAVLLLPFYGLDDPSSLSSHIQTATERFQQYLDLAQKGAASAGFSGQPRRVVVRSFLAGMLDSSTGAIESGLDTMKAPGVNAVYVNLGFVGDLPRRCLCCTEVSPKSARAQYPQAHLLFKRYGHSSGVRTPASGSRQRQQWQPRSPRSGRCAIEAHRRSRACIGRSTPRPWPADWPCRNLRAKSADLETLLFQCVAPHVAMWHDNILI
jgi:hypothetical protein